MGSDFFIRGFRSCVHVRVSWHAVCSRFASEQGKGLSLPWRGRSGSSEGRLDVVGQDLKDSYVLLSNQPFKNDE